MVQKRFRCAGCKKLERERVAGQRYCGSGDCQQERKNAWRRKRYASDASYRQTAQESTAAWLDTQGGAAAYYRNYRRNRKKNKGIQDAQEPVTTAEAANPASGMDKCERLSPKETAKTDAKADANSDAQSAQPAVITGQYLLIPSGGANSDALIVQLSVIAGQSAELQRTTEFSAGLDSGRVEP